MGDRCERPFWVGFGILGDTSMFDFGGDLIMFNRSIDPSPPVRAASMTS